MIGVGLQTWLGLNVGDTLRVTVNDSTQRLPAEWQVVGVYREPADGGQMAMISLRTLRRVDHTAEPDTYFLRLSPNANLGVLRAYLKSRAGESLILAVVTRSFPPAPIQADDVDFVGDSVGHRAHQRVQLVGAQHARTHQRSRHVQDVGHDAATSGDDGAGLRRNVGRAGRGDRRAVRRDRGAGRELTEMGQMFGFGSFDMRPDWVALLLPALVAVGVGVLGSVVPGRWAARLNVVEVLRYE